MLGLIAVAFATLFMAAEPALAAQPQQTRGEPGTTGPQTTEGGQGRTRRQQRGRAPAPNPEQLKASAQEQLTGASINCQVTEAVSPGRVGEANVYEAACATGPGYMILASTPPTIVNCLELAGTAAIARSRDPNADVGQQCVLPANQNGMAVISGWARDAGITCTVDEAVAIGKSNANNMIYEVGCAGATGYWLEQLATGWDVKDCFQVASSGATCRFTTNDEMNAVLQAKLTGTDAAACNVTQTRLMGQNANGKFYEVKCATDGEGFIARVNNEGVTQQVYPCATAQRIGGGCTLTPAPAAAPAAE
ncbi:hypothetical protein GCM10009101_14760 [Brevundimonas lenta]